MVTSQQQLIAVARASRSDVGNHQHCIKAPHARLLGDYVFVMEAGCTTAVIKPFNVKVVGPCSPVIIGSFMRRRILFLLLAMVLPLQLAWGAVSVYCQHESGAAANHFGHHEHVHTGELKQAPGLKLAPDSDCGTCHSAGMTAVVSLQSGFSALGASVNLKAGVQRAPPSLPPDAPERPQWRCLA